MKDPFLDTDHGFSHEDVLLLIAYIKGNMHLLAVLIFFFSHSSLMFSTALLRVC